MDLDLNGGLPEITQTPYVIFGTPTLSGSITLEYFRAYLDTEIVLHQAQIRMACIQVAGCQFIANARNRIVTEFLDVHEAATDLFFIDDDTGWPPEAVLRLMLRPEEVVAGVCLQKNDTLGFPVQLDFEPKRFTQQDGLFLAQRVGCAFMRIKRRALAQMAAQAVRYPDPEGSGLMLYNIFDVGINSTGQLEGEDYAFCATWQRLGGKVWIDPDITFTHVGRKKWTGCLGTSLRQFMANETAQSA